jgi:hypothetical protein
MGQHDGKRLHQAIKASNIKVTDFFSLIGVSRGTMYNYFEMAELPEEVKEKAALVLHRNVNDVFAVAAKQAAAEHNDAALIHVPMATAGNYARQCDSKDYLDTLSRLYIPGLSYRGNGFRYFEMEGDSMEPALADGAIVLAQQLDTGNWLSIYNYYIHVLVTADQILIKRLYQANEYNFILISDNEALYPQTQIGRDKVKELWLVKRKLDWRTMSPKITPICTE